MKRVFCLLTVVSLLLSILILPVSAQDSCEHLDSAIALRFVLRAGGGLPEEAAVVVHPVALLRAVIITVPIIEIQVIRFPCCLG